MSFTSLAYLMDLQWLSEAYHRTRKTGATGVDGQTWHEYGQNLEANLQALLERAKSGRYTAPPVKRAYIPKAGSPAQKRPIGIPTLEDKVLQRAVVMLLEPIYEQDFVIGFTDQKDAHRVRDVLPKRFERYGLKIHPEKTRLVRFNKPDGGNGSGGPAGNGKPESFDLLGFTHYWGRSLRGNWVVKRKTSDSRLSRAARAINQWCRDNRHEPLAGQRQTLSQKIRGHCAYYGITGNSQCLSAFRLWTVRAWRKWLSRRNRERGMPWDRFNQLLDRYPLPAAIAIHSTHRRAANP